MGANKIKQECEFIFKHLAEKDFSLLEIKYVMSSMGLVMSDIVEKDPLRKIVDFNYFSSVDHVFSLTAASKTES